MWVCSPTKSGYLWFRTKLGPSCRCGPCPPAFHHLQLGMGRNLSSKDGVLKKPKQIGKECKGHIQNLRPRSSTTWCLDDPILRSATSK